MKHADALYRVCAKAHHVSSGYEKPGTSAWDHPREHDTPRRLVGTAGSALTWVLDEWSFEGPANEFGDLFVFVGVRNCPRSTTEAWIMRIAYIVLLIFAAISLHARILFQKFYLSVPKKKNL